MKDEVNYYWITISVWIIFMIAGLFTKNNAPLIFSVGAGILYYLVFQPNVEGDA